MKMKMKKMTQGHAPATYAAGMMSSSSESEFLERSRRLADDAAALRSATIYFQQLRFARMAVVSTCYAAQRP
eukprot:COSAG01_NODE_411_length_17360_cov_11.401852_13_plen_72_part_00